MNIIKFLYINYFIKKGISESSGTRPSLYLLALADDHFQYYKSFFFFFVFVLIDQS